MSPPQDLKGLSHGAHAALERLARQHGYADAETYLDRLDRREKVMTNTLAAARKAPLSIAMQTDLGTIYEGNALTYMQMQDSGSHDLIITSPPFGLIRKKDYGNAAAEKYCDWFRPFAKEMHRILNDSGSLVIDIGGGWEKGLPTRSLYHFDLLIMLVREFDFHLCLEHFWFSPTKLPSPAEWVTIRRIRPKDSVNCVWWLSKTPYPKASNKRIVTPYSDRMESLLRDGYEGSKRPSGHDISAGFSQRQQGAIPPNLLAIANTESKSAYSSYCREHGLPIHPARFPAKLPEYFIRMLTNPGDLVFDPFAGSFLTGRVCEETERRWAGTEIKNEYVRGGISRFLPNAPNILREEKIFYQLPAPCAFGNTDDIPFPTDGGRKRAKSTTAPGDSIEAISDNKQEVDHGL